MKLLSLLSVVILSVADALLFKLDIINVKTNLADIFDYNAIYNIF